MFYTYLVKQFAYLMTTIISIFVVVFGVSYLKNNPQVLIINQETTTPTSNSSDREILWGAYTGGSIASKVEFEEIIGRKPDLISTFLLWGEGNYFPIELASNIASNDQTLVIYWESRDANSKNLNDRKYSYDAILNGEWDDYIYEIGQNIRDSMAQVIVIPFVEVNGNWYPWSITKNNNTAEKHKLAFQKIHGMIGDIPNLKFGWAINNGSAPDTAENSIANLYPGDEYIDYVGVDGFNFGNPWQNYEEVFAKSLTELKMFDKPIFIFSTASMEGEKKAEWIHDFGDQLLKYPEIKGFIWFNENKERDWRIWSDKDSLRAFREILTALDSAK